MNPELPGRRRWDNPYQYSDYKSESPRAARRSLFGDAP